MPRLNEGLFLAKGRAFVSLGSESGVQGVESLEEVDIRVGVDCIHSTLSPRHSLPHPLPACLQVRSRPNCVGGCSLRFLLTPRTPCGSLLTELRGVASGSKE